MYRYERLCICRLIKKFCEPLTVFCLTKPEEADQIAFYVASWSEAKDNGTEGCEVVRVQIPSIAELAIGIKKNGTPGRDAASAVSSILGLLEVKELSRMHTHTVLTSQDPYALMAYRIDCLKYVQEVMALDSIDSIPPKIAKLAIKYGYGGSTSDPRKNPLSLFVLPPLQSLFMFTRQWQRAKTCNTCEMHQRQLGKPLLVCGKCKRAQYCSRECQVLHWKAHKSACASLIASESIPGRMVFSAADIFGDSENSITLADMGMSSPAAQSFIGRLYRPKDNLLAPPTMSDLSSFLNLRMR